MFLADIFEKFIDLYLRIYKLDPCHYFSSPGLNRDAVLKMLELIGVKWQIGVKLEKILDIDMYLFTEKGLREGISCIPKIYSKRNNKYVTNYDPTELSKFISYLDMNNLCQGNESICFLWWI